MSTILIMTAFAAMATCAFVCAPLAYKHSLAEGRKIQGKIFKLTYNTVGFALLLLTLIVGLESLIK